MAKNSYLTNGLQHAVVYDAAGVSSTIKNNESNLPLLNAREEDSDKDSEIISKRSHTYSLGLGLTVGTFMQLSTLGAHFLVLSVLSVEFVEKNSIDTFVLPALYSHFMAMALIVLGFLRNLLSMAYGSGRTTDRNQPQVRTANDDDNDNLLQVMLFQLESRFIMGALIGECFAWTATDLLLGMERQGTFAAEALLLTLMYCYVFDRYSDASSNDSSNEEESSYEELGYRNIMVV
jgi:hypothetical protein